MIRTMFGRALTDCAAGRAAAADSMRISVKTIRIRDPQRAHRRSNDGPAQSGAAVHAATHDRWDAAANGVVAPAAPRKNSANSLAIVGRGVG
jgi:hypothetical protein